jgi:hypothetical protein
MKSIILISLLAFSHLIQANSLFAIENQKQNSLNTKYEMIRIKQRSQMGFTNNGQSIYGYFTDADIEGLPPSEIGSLELEKGSMIRNANIGVDLRKSHEFKGAEGEPLRIGTITDHSGNLSGAKIIVNSARQIEY